MTRTLSPGSKLVIASHNRGKLVEIADLIAPFGIEALSAADLGIPEPDETEDTFVGNARLKAEHATRACRLPALADDSGLEVAALAGAPGIYSARWAGESRDFSTAMKTVADQLTERSAWEPGGTKANFTCALCLAWPDGEVRHFEGRVDGRLVWPPRGTRGFGYDPMFIAEGATETYGEMDPSIKHATSHRARAFAKFVEACLAPR